MHCINYLIQASVTACDIVFTVFLSAHAIWYPGLIKRILETYLGTGIQSETSLPYTAILQISVGEIIN